MPTIKLYNIKQIMNWQTDERVSRKFNNEDHYAVDFFYPDMFYKARSNSNAIFTPGQRFVSLGHNICLLCMGTFAHFLINVILPSRSIITR